jgi:asparagine synthase (glutamine-hydrolysing)
MKTEDLLQILRESTRRAIGHETEVAVAYSGGVDSSIVAAIARESAHVNCYTCAVDGSFDAQNAERRAREEGFDLKLVGLTAEDLVKELVVAAQVLGRSDPVPLAYSIPLIMVLRTSTERTTLAGNGADELFAGYAKYSSHPDPEGAMSEDLHKMTVEAARLQNWSSGLGKRLGLPFADDSVISFSKTIPLADKISPSGRKLILREGAKRLGLPSHDRPKKAAQYSSGVLRLMEKAAKESGLSVAEWAEGVVDSSRRSA